MKRLVVLFLVLLGVVGFAVKESAADICWQLDTPINDDPNDTIKADIKFIDLDHKKLVTASWHLTVCSGCTEPPEHPGLVLLTGTFQKGVNGTKEMALSGGIYDDTLNSPFGRHCWLHMKFDPNTLNTGQAVGECEDYFDRFEDAFTKVDCSSVPNP